MGLSYHSWLGMTGVLFFLLFISYAMRGDRQRKKLRYYQSCPLKDPEHFEDTILGGHLPSRYLHRYTPLFYKQFAVCIITVAWKLAQPKHISLSSVAEELAAWAIINQAKVLTEEREDGEAIEKVLEKFIDVYFEDLDFGFLFDNAYDGIDESEATQELGMSSLAFNDWFKPFSDEPSLIAHPYVI